MNNRNKLIELFIYIVIVVSRTINGVNDPNFGITINNLNSDVDVTYTTTIIDQKGQEINLGSFSTEEERLTAVQDYCDEQIRC